MYTVHFLEGKNIVLSQLLRQLPKVGDDLRIKGRKGKVLEIIYNNEKSVNVNVHFEVKKKAPAVAVQFGKKKK
ncbi:hypothetical protein M2M59_07285 [Rummeliibacillus sp. G93]|uniref:hypothetical protein n=1 Tax=Rummeliibacillus sp. G93 TaxID=2939494 RepID=UPI00201C1686|nr:hypothetical protein [Rummeliibacillus sp. G93]UQW98810.1 hypothetical protein M2M59_07285 [Rummeliibacillus sp. G93]